MRSARPISAAAVLLASLGCGTTTAPTTAERPQVRASGVPEAYQGLVINEVAAAGAPHDWFELYNGTDRVIDLSGVRYTDDPLDAPAKATFRDDISIAPGAYRLVTVSDAIQGFKLGRDEVLALLSSDGVLIDIADWAAGDSPAGGSWAQVPDGSGAFETLPTPTPGAPNRDGRLGRAGL